MSHGLRTTGTHTGNFGKARVKGKPGELDLTKEILSKENLRIPSRDEAFTKLVQAYNSTTDTRLKAGLWEILKRRQATIKPVSVGPTVTPVSEYWEEVKRIR